MEGGCEHPCAGLSDALSCTRSDGKLRAMKSDNQNFAHALVAAAGAFEVIVEGCLREEVLHEWSRVFSHSCGSGCRWLRSWRVVPQDRDGEPDDRPKHDHRNGEGENRNEVRLFLEAGSFEVFIT